MESSGPSGPARRGLYGSVPEAGPPGMAPRLLEFADELRREGVAVGTSELLDAFAALEAVSWTSQVDFREALAATLAKSQEDRRILDVLFDSYFFRAVEREAVNRGLTEERFQGAEGLDLDALRERIREALRAGNDGEMRDLARLAIAAFGRQGEGSGVIGVDVQRIRRSLGLRAEPQPDPPEADPRRAGAPARPARGRPAPRRAPPRRDPPLRGAAAPGARARADRAHGDAAAGAPA